MHDARVTQLVAMCIVAPYRLFSHATPAPSAWLG